MKRTDLKECIEEVIWKNESTEKLNKFDQDILVNEVYEGLWDLLEKHSEPVGKKAVPVT